MFQIKNNELEGYSTPITFMTPDNLKIYGQWEVIPVMGYQYIRLDSTWHSFTPMFPNLNETVPKGDTLQVSGTQKKRTAAQLMRLLKLRNLPSLRLISLIMFNRKFSQTAHSSSFSKSIQPQGSSIMNQAQQFFRQTVRYLSIRLYSPLFALGQLQKAVNIGLCRIRFMTSSRGLVKPDFFR